MPTYPAPTSYNTTPLWSTNYSNPITPPYSPRCTHRGDTRLFTIDGRDFYGVSSSGISQCAPYDCLIDLAGISRQTSATGFVNLDDSTLPGLATLLPSARTGQLVRLDWRDYGAPPPEAGVTFWRTLLALLPQGRIVVGCFGSHGRTGTCLAAFRIACLGDSVPNAVNFVRFHHCAEAVEAAPQLEYLWRLSKTAGTHTQPYDHALADALTATLAPVTPTTPPPPSTSPAPTTRGTTTDALIDVTYQTRDGGLVTVSAASWIAADYFSTTFRPSVRSESRILRFS